MTRREAGLSAAAVGFALVTGLASSWPVFLLGFGGLLTCLWVLFPSAGRRHPESGTAKEVALLQQKIRELLFDEQAARRIGASAEQDRLLGVVEELSRFGLREDEDHPGFSEIGMVPNGAFLNREQVIDAIALIPRGRL
jgi:hypothetical protein